MDAKYYADQLAVCAVTGNKAALVKVAAAYTKSAAFDLSQLGGQLSSGLQTAWNTPVMRNAMIGMGAGGLLGLMQPKRKFRNALQYGLLGGLGGLGYSALSGDLSKYMDPKKDAAPPAAAPAAGAATPPAQNPAIPGLPARELSPQEAQAVKVMKGSPLTPTIGGAVAGGVAGGTAGNLGARFLERRLQHNVTNLTNDATNAVGQELAKLRKYAPNTGSAFARERPGAAAAARDFALDFATDPAKGSNNRFLSAGISNAGDAQNAINNAAELISRGKLPMSAEKTRQMLQDTVRVINAENPQANMTLERLQQALRGANTPMPWLRRIGTIGGGLGGAFIGGSAGANWDASRRNAAAAELMRMQSGTR